MRKLPLAIAAILLATTSSCFAMEQSWYGKVGFGTTDYDISETGGVDLDDPTGYNLTLGYQWNSYVAFEGSYVDLGEASYSVSEDFAFGTATARASLSVDTLVMGTVISTDTNMPFSGGFKLGYHFWDAEAKGSVSVSGIPEERFSESTDGTDLYYGLVGTYRTGQWLVSLEYTIYEAEDADPSVTALSLGMQF